jgi:hypothetical protein
MKNKKYVFELVVRESENLEKIFSTITACDYSFEELKERKVDHDILLCKDILMDQLPKNNLKRIFAEHKNTMQQYPEFASSWDDMTYDEALDKMSKSYNKSLDKSKKLYAFYHKPTKLWVYFLPNYDERQIISLGLKNDATTFIEKDIEYYTDFLKYCSFNGVKCYGGSNFLEFELKKL